MGQHGARKQKKLAKQKAKRNARHAELARRESKDPTVRLAGADLWPIVATLVPDNIWDEGIGQAVIARRLPDGRLAVGVFLIDIFCLGVKNAFWTVAVPEKFEEMRTKLDEVGHLIPVSPEYLSKLVHCAADYAQSIGFFPHPDFRHARLLLHGIDPSQCHERFEFGREGKPFYFRGPHETLAEANAIARRVESAGGHTVIAISESNDGTMDLSNLGMEFDEDSDDEGDDETSDADVDFR